MAGKTRKRAQENAVCIDRPSHSLLSHPMEERASVMRLDARSGCLRESGQDQRNRARMSNLGTAAPS
eukprot:1889657-Pyramimonas_sp.AAC.1